MMARGVYELDMRAASGAPVLVAVDSRGRERARAECVGGVEAAVELGAALWTLLDTVDPLVVRLEVSDGGGRTVREPANRKLGALQ